VHCTVGTIRPIGTRESAYWDLSAGKLEEHCLVRVAHLPRQQSFHSDGEACLSVAVHHLTTLYTFEQGVVFRMPLSSHSTAVATPFRGVVWVKEGQVDAFVEASTLQRAFELEYWHTEDLAVEFVAFRFEAFQLLDGYVCVMLKCKVCDVSDDFSDAVLDKVVFLASESAEGSSCSVAASVCETSESITPKHYSGPLGPDIFAEVQLPDDFAFRCKDCEGEGFAVHINAEHVPPIWSLSFLFQKCDDLSIRCQAVGFAYPP